MPDHYLVSHFELIIANSQVYSLYFELVVADYSTDFDSIHFVHFDSDHSLDFVESRQAKYQVHQLISLEVIVLVWHSHLEFVTIVSAYSSHYEEV